MKRRQFKLFETLLNSSIRVLENLSTPTDSTDNYQVVFNYEIII